MYHILNRILNGNGAPEDIDLLNRVALGIQGKCFCALGEFSITPVVAAIEHFRSDFEALTGDGK
jgi:NADH-quinone oxidoreductase subunit F